MNLKLNEEAAEFLANFLNALASGPIGAQLIECAAGTRRIRVRQNRTGEGWVLDSEAVEESAALPADVRADPGPFVVVDGEAIPRTTEVAHDPFRSTCPNLMPAQAASMCGACSPGPCPYVRGNR